MEELEVTDLDRRIRHLEREVAQMSVLIARNAEILDDIRNLINKPVNYPAWIAVAIASLTMVGGVMYAAYIAPLDHRLYSVEKELQRRAPYIEDHDKMLGKPGDHR